MVKNILDKLAEEVDKIEVSGKNKETNDKQPALPADEQAVSDKRQKVSVKKKKAKAKNGLPKKSLPTGKEDKEIKDELSMEELLEESPIEIPEIGDVMEGKVIEIFSNYILLDLGPLGTGIVLGKEMKDGLNAGGKLKKGDTVSATLINLGDEDGYIELSVREASYEKAWENIEYKRDAQEAIATKVLDANRGGLIVEINGISSFLPVSQLSSKNYPRVEDGNKSRILEMLSDLIGQELKVKIISADRDEEKLIVSEKAVMSNEEKETVAKMKVGDIVEGEVSGVVDFGAFVKFFPLSKKDSDKEEDKMEGLVHISELAWQLINDPREVIKKGDTVKAQIIGINDTRVSLSIKALAKDPWENVEKKYKIGDVVKGEVDKINRFGVFVYLDKNIHGLAHVSEFQEMYPGKRMDDVIKEGESYQWKILSMEPKNHRMGLVLVKDKEGGKKESSVKQKAIDKKIIGDKKKIASKKEEKKTTKKKEGEKKKKSAK